jgi:hypothetical protein
MKARDLVEEISMRIINTAKKIVFLGFKRFSRLGKGSWFLLFGQMEKKAEGKIDAIR